ncbi:hypothetical protein HNQ94_000985 [Salirhabdus euzebyi]|uniref:Uncharacterized protein n=1 Tax=Salirhabdus euzebyi TaxID=394506 RepID=A0A841PUQ5_9BACI|nr:hypothetical protein [Salirhabdus euzebyi]MBB6452540.1 hypothetical protein [Salirhabdus euzebyi]
MSEYQDFLHERDRIDFLLQKGYKITNVTENLSGAFVDFEKSGESNGEAPRETLHILNADARKYFSAMLMKQQKEEV